MGFVKAAPGTALVLIAAAAGGWLFNQMHLPAAWLTGSMISVALLAMLRAPVVLPAAARSPLFALMGISMGTAFTPETMASMFKWPVSIASLMATVALVIVACVAFLILHAKWDRATAFFAVVPGALSTVLILAMRSPANTGLVIMAQSVRLFALLALLPIAVTATVPSTMGAAPGASTEPLLLGRDAIAGLILAGSALGYVLEKLRFPAGLFVGAMAGSAALHLTGLVSGRMPQEILIPCQVMLGAFIGIRFRDTDLSLFRQALKPSAWAFSIALLISGVAAASVAAFLHLPLGTVLVAFAPGGIEAMSVLAFVLGLDAAFVGVHQLARFIGISLMLPVAAKYYVGEGK